MPVLRDWDLAVDADLVLWGQGADPERIRARRPVLVTIAEQAIAEGWPLVAPTVVFERLPVSGLRHERLQLSGGYLSGPLVAEHLAPASEVLLAVCTVGEELTRYATQRFSENASAGFALDGLASAATQALAETACRRFEAMAVAEDLRTSTPLQPGMVGWPVDDGQRQIFGLLDAGQIGVSLTESGLMMPVKSLSFVIGLGREMKDGGSTCDYCAMRDTCVFRNVAEDHKHREP